MVYFYYFLYLFYGIFLLFSQPFSLVDFYVFLLISTAIQEIINTLTHYCLKPFSPSNFENRLL